MSDIKLKFQTVKSIRETLMKNIYSQARSYDCSVYDVTLDVLRGMMKQQLDRLNELYYIDEAIKQYEKELSSPHGKGENTDTTETQTDKR